MRSFIFPFKGYSWMISKESFLWRIYFLISPEYKNQSIEAYNAGKERGMYKTWIGYIFNSSEKNREKMGEYFRDKKK